MRRKVGFYIVISLLALCILSAYGQEIFSCTKPPDRYETKSAALSPKQEALKDLDDKNCKMFVTVDHLIIQCDKKKFHFKKRV